jgi:transposase
MRGDDQQQSGMFSYVSLEDRVPQDHPLRHIREMVDEILRGMAKDALYAKTGRPSVPTNLSNEMDYHTAVAMRNRNFRQAATE